MRSSLERGDEETLRNALLASVESVRRVERVRWVDRMRQHEQLMRQHGVHHEQRMSAVVPRRPDDIPRCFCDNDVLTHPDKECLWDVDWLVGAC